MGIELPAELADVAAAAGVRWPEADETAMLSAAGSWRQAGRRLGSLTSDADADARSALNAFEGDAADAAHRHWNRYVREDGRLPAAIRECTAAADRLEHGAREVAAAKTRLIRELVALKQQQDAARQAQAAGFAHPLAAVNTLVAGTASNVAQVQQQLTQSIRLENGGTPALSGTITTSGPTGLVGTISGALPLVDAHNAGLPGVPGTAVRPGVVDPAAAASPVVAASPVTLPPDVVPPSGTGADVDVLQPVSGAIDRALDPTGAGSRPPDTPAQVQQALASAPAAVPTVPRLDTAPAGGTPSAGAGVPGGGSLGTIGGLAPGGTGGTATGGPVTGGSGSGGSGSGGSVGSGSGGAGSGGSGSGGSGGSGSGGSGGAGTSGRSGVLSGVSGGGSPSGGGGALGGGALTGGGPIAGSGGTAGGSGVAGGARAGGPGGTAVGGGTASGGGTVGGGAAGGGGVAGGAGGGGGSTAGGGTGGGAAGGGGTTGGGGASGGGAAGGGQGGGGTGGTGARGGGVPLVGVGGGPVGGADPAPATGQRPVHQAPVGGPGPGAPGSGGPPTGGGRAGIGGPIAVPGAPLGAAIPTPPPGTPPAPGAPSAQPPAGQPTHAAPPADVKQPSAGHHDVKLGPTGQPDAKHMSSHPDAKHVSSSHPDAKHASSGHPDAKQVPGGHPDGKHPPSGQPDGKQGAGGQADGKQPAGGQGDGRTSPQPVDPRRVGVPAGGMPAQPAPVPDLHDGDQNRAPAEVRKPRAGFVVGPMMDPGDAGAAERAARTGRQDGADDPLALFLLFMFPPEHAAQPARIPARQVAVPPQPVEPPTGLCFQPGDHPRAGLVDGATPAPDRGPAVTADGLGPDDGPVLALTAGHDPLGGLHERDWDDRFLVREATHEQAAEYAWPPGEAYPEGGCDPDAVEPVVLEPGAVLDRFGDPAGRLLAADGTPYPQRSLPPEYQEHGYHRYRVEQPLPVWRTVSAAWFGQPGGGVRYRATHAVADLVALGFLTDITESTAA